MKTLDLVRRLDELLEMGINVLSTKHSSRSGEREYIDSSVNAGFRSATLSFIDRVYGRAHPHFKEFEENTNGYYPSSVETGIAIIQAMKSEIRGCLANQ